MESLGGPRKGSIDVGAISVALIARIIYILKFCIPDLHLQAEKAESMVRLRLTLLRSPDEMDQIKTELEGYFDAIGKKINGAIILYVLLNLCIFFLVQSFLSYLPLSHPMPGLLVVPKFVVSLGLTAIVSSLGWLKLIFTKSTASLLRQELKERINILF